MPLVYRWARQARLQESDAADIVQEVFQTLATRIQDFRRDQPGDSFRGWLYSITRNKIRDHFRSVAHRPDAPGGTEAYAQLEALPEETTVEQISKLTADLAHRAAALMKVDFEPRSWQVFWRVVCQTNPCAFGPRTAIRNKASERHRYASTRTDAAGAPTANGSRLARGSVCGSGSQMGPRAERIVTPAMEWWSGLRMGRRWLRTVRPRNRTPSESGIGRTTPFRSNLNSKHG